MVVAERTQAIDQTGRIAVSDEAQAALGLVGGTRLMEMVVDGMLLYVPVSEEIIEAFDDFERLAAEQGVTADDLIADIEREREPLAPTVTHGGE